MTGVKIEKRKFAKAFILVLLFSMSIIPAFFSVSAIETVYVTPEGWMYEIYAYKYNNKVHIEGYNGSDSIVSIPSDINGRPVTAIKSFAFDNNAVIEQINIPNSVSIIGSYAFRGCSKLKSVVIPGSAKDLGNGLFDNCNSLTTATLEEGITSTSEWMFNKCSLLQSIKLPSSLISISDKSFWVVPCLDRSTFLQM